MCCDQSYCVRVSVPLSAVLRHSVSTTLYCPLEAAVQPGANTITFTCEQSLCMSLTWDAPAALTGQPVSSVHTEPQLFQENFHLPWEQQRARSVTLLWHQLLIHLAGSTQPSHYNHYASPVHCQQKSDNDLLKLKTQHRFVCFFSKDSGSQPS